MLIYYLVSADDSQELQEAQIKNDIADCVAALMRMYQKLTEKVGKV